MSRNSANFVASFNKTKLFEFLSRQKLRPGGTEASLLLKKALPPMGTSSLNYFVMQYLFNTKNQINFDPVGALSHFVVPDSVKGPRNEGQTGDEETSPGEVTVSREISSSRSYNPRLEILKMRAAQRPKIAAESNDTPELEQSQ